MALRALPTALPPDRQGRCAMSYTAKINLASAVLWIGLLLLFMPLLRYPPGVYAIYGGLVLIAIDIYFNRPIRAPKRWRPGILLVVGSLVALRVIADLL